MWRISYIAPIVLLFWEAAIAWFSYRGSWSTRWWLYQQDLERTERLQHQEQVLKKIAREHLRNRGR